MAVRRRRYLVATTDLQAIGQAGIVEARYDRDLTIRENLETVSSDPVARVSDGRPFIVNRLSFDNLQGLDPAAGLSLVPEAHAVVGAPLTPVSVAGVARRTAYRTAAVTTTAAASQASAQAAAAQQQAATAQQQAATAQQQSATAQQQSAAAQQQAVAAQPAPAAAPPPAAAAPGHALPLGTVVASLPAGCTQLVSGGIQYSKCGANYYRAVFQGNNLVYVTAQP